MSNKTQNLPTIESVSGEPEKDFFVNMLTRDIELQDAVLDLLDNCVDGVLRVRDTKLAKADSLVGFWAKITLDESKFTIEDNCGGIPWDIASEYAFKMGKSADYDKRPAGTIGLVGIGMKRAIFKMGRECYVHSNTKENSFMVEILSNWFSQDGWDFPARREKPQSDSYGTIIEISNLTPSTKLAFSKNSDFRTKFNTLVGQSYAYLIEKGFSVFINGEPVVAKLQKLHFASSALGDVIRPYVFEASLDGVDVFFAIGYRSPLSTEEEREIDAAGTFTRNEAGWTVVCNDRVVLSNDTTTTTGWGFGGVPSFHNQFSSIAGVVEFKCHDTGKLPLTTTKRGIDAGKEIFVLVRQKMQEATKWFTSNTNRWKGHEADLKKRFTAAPAVSLPEVKKNRANMTLRAVPGAKFSQKQYKPQLPEKAKLLNESRISFVKSKTEIAKVSEYLFDEQRSPAEVGSLCFDRILKLTK